MNEDNNDSAVSSPSRESQSSLESPSAPESRPSLETRSSQESHPSFPHELRGWVRDLAVAMSLALIIIVFLYQPVKVEGTSMAPLLSDQERIFINKFVYRFEPIEHGYFVMGDHRDSSNDSRMFGAVSREFIYGKAVFAYWPVDHFGSITTAEAGSK